VTEERALVDDDGAAAFALFTEGESAVHDEGW